MLPTSVDGPTAFIADPAANVAWAQYFSARCSRRRQMGPSYLQLLLTPTSPGPITSLRGAADVRGGPTVFIADPAANFAWAHYFSKKCYRRPWMGPLDLLLLLPLTSPGPIIFLRGVAELLGWAHCIYSRSCRWLHMGP